VSTPEIIESLEPGQVFVFGSNAQGLHAGGAARVAHEKFGAIWGEGEGLHGDSYALPTMEGPDAFRRAVARFLRYAATRPDLTFLVTPVGCGIAGYSPNHVAPWFRGAPSNVTLPAVFETALKEGAHE